MTIEEVMAIAAKRRPWIRTNKFCGTGRPFEVCIGHDEDTDEAVVVGYATLEQATAAAHAHRDNELRAALLALVASERDEEAEACAVAARRCEFGDTASNEIRARIVARRGQPKPADPERGHAS